MPRSVGIGGYHQIAEPETAETLVSELREPRFERLSVVNSCEASIRRTRVRLMPMAQNDPPPGIATIFICGQEGFHR